VVCLLALQRRTFCLDFLPLFFLALFFPLPLYRFPFGRVVFSKERKDQLLVTLLFHYAVFGFHFLDCVPCPSNSILSFSQVLFLHPVDDVSFPPLTTPLTYRFPFMVSNAPTPRSTFSTIIFAIGTFLLVCSVPHILPCSELHLFA